MNNYIQTADIWKRIAAWIFDAFLVGVLAAVCGLFLSWVLRYDEYSHTMQEANKRYETQYGVVFDITQEEYQALNEDQKNNYDAAYAALANDPEASHAYRMMLSLTLLITTLGLLLAFLIWEFFLPLRFGNGQTLGKKIFGLCLIRKDGVKLSTIQLFTRTILGKYTVETMIPVFMFLMLIFGTSDLFTLAVPLILFAAQCACLMLTRNHAAIHDLMAVTVVADMASQQIFRTPEDLVAYQKKAAAELAARQPY